jgi:hypothetical protein
MRELYSLRGAVRHARRAAVMKKTHAERKREKALGQRFDEVERCRHLERVTLASGDIVCPTCNGIFEKDVEFKEGGFWVPR